MEHENVYWEDPKKIREILTAVFEKVYNADRVHISDSIVSDFICDVNKIDSDNLVRKFIGGACGIKKFVQIVISKKRINRNC